MDNINIKFDHGKMEINIKHFFPNTQQNCVKLIKIIKRFSYLNNASDIIAHFNHALNSRIHFLKAREELYGKTCCMCTQVLVSLDTLITADTLNNKLKKQVKKHAQYIKSLLKSNKYNLNQVQKDILKLHKNLEIINTLQV